MSQIACTCFPGDSGASGNTPQEPESDPYCEMHGTPDDTPERLRSASALGWPSVATLCDACHGRTEPTQRVQMMIAATRFLSSDEIADKMVQKGDNTPAENALGILLSYLHQNELWMP